MKIDKKNIVNKINTARKLRYITNFYAFDLIDGAERIWETDDSFMFSYKDHGISRLAFYSKDYDILESLISKIQFGTYYMEIVTNNVNEYAPSNMILKARMMRLSTKNVADALNNSELAKYRNDEIALKATPEDAHEINEILWNTFETGISHLLYDEEIVEKIEKGNIYIHKNGKIDALLQAEIMPKQFYINQIVNFTDKKIIHAVLQSRLWKYVNQGGSYVYAWVDENNMPSIKFHEKYGLKHDGMWNLVCFIDKSF